MTMQQLILLGGIIFAAPLCIGLLPVSFMQERHRNIGMVYSCGWLMMFASFQLMVIPFIVNRIGFSVVARLFTGIVLALCLLGIGCGIWKRNLVWRLPAKRTWFLWGMIVLLVVMQMVFSFYMQYLDGDDAYYVAMSLSILTDDKMYLTNPYYGYSQELDVRHALSPVPIFIAWMGRVTGMHVTVLSHSFLGPAFILVRNVLYGLIGSRIFEKEQEKVPLFLLFLNLWYLFGNVSLYTVETFAYTRIWQGKSMFGNLVVPAMLLWMFFVVKEQMKAGEWVMLFLLSAVAAFTTSIGIFLFPVFIVLAGVWIALHRKNVVVLFEFCVCCIPSFVYGILYLFLRLQ